MYLTICQYNSIHKSINVDLILPYKCLFCQYISILGSFLININNLLIYIDFIYRIDHPLFNVLMINIRIIALSTKRINKFVDFRSIIHCFQFETILLQDLAMGLHYRMPFPGNQIFSQKIWEN